MKKGTSTKKRKAKKNLEYITVEDRTFTVRTAPSGNKYIQASFGNKPDGKPLVKKFTAPTLKELEAEILDFINGQDGKSGANLTYYNACMQYVETRAALSESTKSNRLNIINNRFKCLRDKPIMKLTRLDFYQAITEDAERGLSKLSMRTALNLLTAVCTEYEVPAMTPKLKRDLANYGTIAAKANKGRKDNEDWENAPSPFDIAKWAGENTADNADMIAIAILLDLHSLRSEESRGLMFREVFEDGGKCYINIVRTKTTIRSKDHAQENCKNECSKRKILIDRRLYDMIHSQPHQSEDEYILDCSYHVYAEGMKKVIHSHTVNRHSLNWITPHTLRHIFKTSHIGDPVAIKVGGWTVEGGVSEKTYTHITQRHMDELMTEYSKKLLDAYEGVTEPNITVTATAAIAEKLG